MDAILRHLKLIVARLRGERPPWLAPPQDPFAGVPAAAMEASRWSRVSRRRPRAPSRIATSTPSGGPSDRSTDLDPAGVSR
jgi:hypothetical protein